MSFTKLSEIIKRTYLEVDQNEVVKIINNFDVCQAIICWWNGGISIYLKFSITVSEYGLKAILVKCSLDYMQLMDSCVFSS